ncbi:MAG: GTPase HflX [Coriobacteriales bacterium]|nr:GTPase HflX [Coriobacteriales bacterium]
MVKEAMFYTEQPREKALLIGVDRENSGWSLEESLAELERLTLTDGADVVGSISQRLKSINPKTFIGSGKLAEVSTLITAMDVDVVIFDDELSPSQQSNLERELGKARKGLKVIDRTALILDIFALHAKSREGRLQIRLAQSQYILPRLRGMWQHLASNRMGGGVGSRFGEGESQLEVDRRIVRKRIDSIRHELGKLRRERSTQRSARLGSGIFKVALAGYTNSGKSTLLNLLTDADVLAEDQLFATLDATTRRITLPDGREATLTDTVGFIQKLPTTLVEAFRSTLDEISEADLILHIVDASSEQRDKQIEAVWEVLEQIGAHQIPQALVYNKCDLLDAGARTALSRSRPDSIMVSAQTGSGIQGLLKRIEAVANASSILIDVLIPYDQGALVHLAHDRTAIISEQFTSDGTALQLRVPSVLLSRFAPYSNKPVESQPESQAVT